MQSLGVKRGLAALLCVITAVGTSSAARAACENTNDTWCHSNTDVFDANGTTFFCDDFDRYCNTPPSDPTKPCLCGSAWGPGGVNTMRSKWVTTSFNTNTNEICGTQFNIEDDSTRLESSPFGGKYPEGPQDAFGQQTLNLIPSIQAQFGNSYTTVIGTDLHPLILRFEMNGGNCNVPGPGCNLHLIYDNGYMELGLDTDPGAPTDYIMVGSTSGTDVCTDPQFANVGTCHNLCPGPNFGPHVPWPTICQSYSARVASPACPPAMPGIRHALAIGANSFLDNDPCHCSDPSFQKPQNSHLSYFDGWKWLILSSGLPKCTGNFVMGTKFNSVTLTIKTNTVDITHSTKIEGTDPTCPGANVTSTITGLPRLYQGAFNKLRGGFAAGCGLHNDTYTCNTGGGVNGSSKCFQNNIDRCDGLGKEFLESQNIDFDDVYLKGGGPDVQTGACCMPNATCQEISGDDCAAAGGSFNGVLSTCAETVCCHKPYADADGDGDTDMDDYGVFQKCYTSMFPGVTGTCKCFDRTAPTGQIDADDFDAFKNCVSGPGVPWSLVNTPSCNPCPAPPALAPGCP